MGRGRYCAWPPSRWGGYAGTWFWIDPVYNLIVVGMIQHRGDGSPDVRALSRSLTYQAIVK